MPRVRYRIVLLLIKSLRTLANEAVEKFQYNSSFSTSLITSVCSSDDCLFGLCPIKIPFYHPLELL